jgi:hypothetical protein
MLVIPLLDNVLEIIPYFVKCLDAIVAQREAGLTVVHVVDDFLKQRVTQ